MNVRTRDRGRDAGRKIAVRDQPDAGTRGPHFVHKRLMPAAIEAHDRQIVHVAAEPAGDVLEVFGDRGINVDRAAARRPDDDFVHKHIGRVQKPAAFGSGEDGNRVVGAEGGECGVREFPAVVAGEVEIDEGVGARGVAGVAGGRRGLEEAAREVAERFEVDLDALKREPEGLDRQPRS